MEEKEDVCCWIDKENSVVSFHQEDGFEENKFASHEEMLNFCRTLISVGFRIR